MIKDDYTLASDRDVKDFDFLERLNYGRPYPVMLGYVVYLNGLETSALWSEDGKCVQLGAATSYAVAKVADLVPLAEKRAKLERQFDDIWPLVHPDYNYATVSKYNTPSFFSARPAFNPEEQNWFREKWMDHRYDIGCFRIKTGLPVNKRLVVRPGYECKMVV